MKKENHICQELKGKFPNLKVLDRYIDRIAYASDASFYRLIPEAVIQPENEEQIQQLFKFCRTHQISMTFRAGGTSLSGQAITDGFLIDISKSWNQINVLENGQEVECQVGIIGQKVNDYLRPYGVKIGPDPASINACMIGGILANNSSGMCCGVSQNAYHTIKSISFILPNGIRFDTNEPNSKQQFKEKVPELHQTILDLKEKIENNPDLKEMIRSKYLYKNTTGYSLNAFIDFDEPLDIFIHLLIGSEGTLAFISKANLKTVPDHPKKYTGLLLFEDIQDATDSIQSFKDSGAAALEIMDASAIKSVRKHKGLPEQARENFPEKGAVLLVEYQASRQEELTPFIDQCKALCQNLKLLAPAEFTEDPSKQALYWKIRKGMFPSVGAVRQQGAAVIIEDVVFPVQHLSKGVRLLQDLFQKYGYHDAIIFGHAKDGNLHFVITPKFGKQETLDTYRDFIDELVNNVVKYQGALKAEHGTGRNMAPFVETEWGSDAYQIMETLKRAVDPQNILNPGVIINGDASCHLKDIKELPIVETEVDKCIECGFCEPKCPSRQLTLSPRQRIVVRRELARLQAHDNKDPHISELLKDYEYDGIDTCAVDGLCATACPVDINTGNLVKRLRKESFSDKAQTIALKIHNHFSLVERGLRFGLAVGHLSSKLLGIPNMNHLTKALNKIAPFQIPTWSKEMPYPSKALPRTSEQKKDFIYFPTCISRTMGLLPGETAVKNLPETMIEISKRAKLNLHIPKNVIGQCCGTPFSSKGFHLAYQQSINQFVENAWKWTEEGKFPIVLDVSSCTGTLKNCKNDLSAENQILFEKMSLLDSIEFLYDYVLPHLTINQKLNKVTLHPICSAIKMNLTQKLHGIAHACSNEANLPVEAGCCGFAGDRGMLFPELTASATKSEAKEVNQSKYDGYYSSGRTCEMGLSRATGQSYQSIVYLLEKASRP